MMSQMMVLSWCFSVKVTAVDKTSITCDQTEHLDMFVCTSFPDMFLLCYNLFHPFFPFAVPV